MFTHSNDVDECRFARILQSDQRQFHLFLPEETFEPVQDPIDYRQHFSFLLSRVRLIDLQSPPMTCSICLCDCTCSFHTYSFTSLQMSTSFVVNCALSTCKQQIVRNKSLCRSSSFPLDNWKILKHNRPRRTIIFGDKFNVARCNAQTHNTMQPTLNIEINE